MDKAQEKIIEWMESGGLEFWVTSYKGGKPEALAHIDKANLLKLWLYKLEELGYRKPPDTDRSGLIKKLTSVLRNTYYHGRAYLTPITEEEAVKRGLAQILPFIPDKLPKDRPKLRKKIAKAQRCLRNCRLYPSLCRKYSKCKIAADTEDYEMADQILALISDVPKDRLDYYRAGIEPIEPKPKDKPPLLSPEELTGLYHNLPSGEGVVDVSYVIDRARRIAQAQWDRWDKWYEEENEG